MPRIRNIKPEFFKDEDIAHLPVEARLFFIGLWCMADRDGIVEYRPKRLKAELAPYDDWDIESICGKLENPDIPERPGKQFILTYRANDQLYIQIIGFSKHQRPHHLEKQSTLPKSDNSLKTDKTCRSTSLDGSNTDTTPLPNGLNPLESGILNLESGDGNGAHLLHDHAFKKLLAIYPEAGQQIGVADGQAFSLFRSDVSVADHGPLLQAARNYAASKQVADGYCRQIIKFLVAGYWRNWTDVKPSGGGEYVKDTSAMDELAERKRIREENAKNGVTGPRTRPNWTVSK